MNKYMNNCNFKCVVFCTSCAIKYACNKRKKIIEKINFNVGYCVATFTQVDKMN